MRISNLLTVDEVAERLKCHPRTVRRWIGAGKLGHVRAGGLIRIPEEEVVRLLERPAGSNGTKRGVEALRATIRDLRGRVTSDDVKELTRAIHEGGQPAEWESPVG